MVIFFPLALSAIPRTSFVPSSQLFRMQLRAKAAEDSRTPKPSESRGADDLARILGVRLSPAAFEGVGTVLAVQNSAPQNTPPMGSDSAAEIPGIVLFLGFLAFRASVRNGCARLWVSAQGCEWRRRKVGPVRSSLLLLFRRNCRRWQATGSAIESASSEGSVAQVFGGSKVDGDVRAGGVAQPVVRRGKMSPLTPSPPSAHPARDRRLQFLQ